MASEERLYLHSEDREILRHLYAMQAPVSIYYFHERYQLSPGQIARVVRKYAERNIVELEDDRIVLTQSGRNWLLRNRRLIFLTKGSKIWNRIPDAFRNEKKQAGEQFQLTALKVLSILKRKLKF